MRHNIFIRYPSQPEHKHRCRNKGCKREAKWTCRQCAARICANHGKNKDGNYATCYVCG